MKRVAMRPLRAWWKLAKARVAPLVLLGLVGLLALVAVAAVISGVVGPKSKAARAEVIPGGEKVIALVGEMPITANDLENEFLLWMDKPDNDVRNNFDSMREQRRKIVNNLRNDLLMREAMRRVGITESEAALRKFARENARLVVERVYADARSRVEQTRQHAVEKNDPRTLPAVDEVAADLMIEYMVSEGGTRMTTITPNQFIGWYVEKILLNEKKEYRQFRIDSRRRMIGAALIQRMGLRVNEDLVKKMATKEVKARWLFVKAAANTSDALRKAKDEAMKLRAEAVRETARFPELAARASSDVSARRGGDLGWVKGGWAELPTILVEYLAFSTPPSAISPVVLTARSTQLEEEIGYSFVLVEDVRDRGDLEKDYSWENQRELALLSGAERFEAGIGREYLNSMNITTGITYKSPELQYYSAEKAGNYAKADTLLQQMVDDTVWPMSPPARAAFAYLAMMITDKLEDRIALLEQATPYAGKGVPEYHAQIAQFYHELGKRQEALEHLHYADIMSSDNNPNLRRRMVEFYREMGAEEEAKRLEKWLADYNSVSPQDRIKLIREEQQ